MFIFSYPDGAEEASDLATPDMEVLEMKATDLATDLD